MKPTELTETEEKNWQMIEQYYEAWKKKDFGNVKFASNFHYSGPGGQEFKNSQEFIASASFLINHVKVEMVVKKKFIDGDNIAVFYDFVTDIPSIGIIDTSGLYKLKNGEIESIVNYFDPRALHAFREQMAKAGNAS